MLVTHNGDKWTHARDFEPTYRMTIQNGKYLPLTQFLQFSNCSYLLPEPDVRTSQILLLTGGFYSSEWSPCNLKPEAEFQEKKS